MRTMKNLQIPIPSATIHIIGEDNMNVKLLYNFLEREPGKAFRCVQHSPGNIPSCENESLWPQLILFDCSNDDDLEELLGSLKNRKIGRDYPFFMVLWGVKMGKDIESVAVDYGIHGVFYENDSPDTIRQGIRSVINGQPWYPKHPRKHHGATAGGDQKPGLTGRETEILFLILTENSTKQIAKKFGISVYTINSHISNIYRKINVSNRINAALWAKKNLKFKN